MSDRPDLDEAIKILQGGGFKIVGGKYAPPEVQAEWVRKLNDDSANDDLSQASPTDTTLLEGEE